MDMIDLEVGIVVHILLQGRGVVILMDMDTLEVVLVGLLGLEHNPLEGVGRGFQPFDKENADPLLAVWSAMPKS